jgi:RNA polymerase sigma factor (sigma-70 family)
VFTNRRDSDERLVAFARAGDEQAFERLYARYRPELLAFCRHLTGQREDAEDAVQFTFYVTYREIVGTTRPLDLRPWLFTVARNRCSSLLRRRRAHPTLRALDGREAATEPPPDELERREELRELIRDLQALPVQQREALLLSEIADLRHAEIAPIIGVSQAKVKALVFQARSSLTTAREARDADCEDIRQELATQSGGALRRRRLRRHVRGCVACSAFEHALGEQRRRIAALVPLAGGSAPLGSGLTSLGAAGSSGGASTLAGGLTGALMAAGADGALKAAIAVVAVAGSGIAVAGVTQNSSDRPAGRLPSADVARLSPSEAGSAPVRPVKAGLGPRSRAPTGPAAPPGRADRTAGGAERTDRTGRRGDVAPAADEDPATGRASVPADPDGDGSSRGAVTKAEAVEPPGQGGAPPGQARKEEGGLPPGQTDKENGGARPGQAGNEEGGSPPGQARKENAAAPPGQVLKENGAAPPGQVGRQESAPPPGQVRKEDGVPPPGQVQKPEPVATLESAPKGDGSPDPPSAKGPEGKQPFG